MRTKISLLALLFSLICGSLNAALVVGTNVQLEGSGADWSLTAVHENGTYSVLDFTKSDPHLGLRATLTPINWTVDTEADYYVAPAGAEFTGVTIAAGQFSPFFVKDKSTPISVLYNTPFYLGINTGQTFLAPGVPARDQFGWVELEATRTGLVMIDNAMAYEAAGIVIGQYEVIAIPESTHWGIVAAISPCLLLLPKIKKVRR